MIDYRAIAALQAVLENQSFDLAAQKLFITQSAVSQRIALLEKHYGNPVLLRTLPYQPTELGKLLLGHYKRLLMLEDSLHAELTAEIQSQKLSIAISRDSLETWFMQVISELKTLGPFNLEIITDDQELTIDYLKKGLVAACVSTQSKAITGCQSQYLGSLDYVLVASPQFIQQYFKNKNTTEENLLRAPYLVFDHHDYLHHRYLKKYFNISVNQANQQMIPSVEGFRQFVLKGYAYGLIPLIDIEKDLKSKKLIQLFPDKIWEMPLYWHSWTIENKVKTKLDSLILKVAKCSLIHGEPK